MQDIFQIMGSSWDDWEPRDPANWHNWNYRQNQDDWQEQGNKQKTGSNNSWQNKDWVVVNKNKHIQARIDARIEKQKNKQKRLMTFQEIPLLSGKPASKQRTHVHAHVPIPNRLVGKPRKKVHHQMLSNRL